MIVSSPIFAMRHIWPETFGIFSPRFFLQIQATDIWRMENEFYEFALDHFHFIRKKSMDIRKSDLVENGTQMFFYEKIRPKIK